MARKKQEGNRFFRMDADFFSDRKIKILKARYGADGIVLYLYLLCEIYKTGYYLQVDDDFEYIISDDLNMDGNKVKQVLNFLLERSLFDDTLFQSDKQRKTETGNERSYKRFTVVCERSETITSVRNVPERNEKGRRCGSRMLTRKNTDSALQRSKTTNRAAALPETVTRGRRTAAG